MRIQTVGVAGIGVLMWNILEIDGMLNVPCKEGDDGFSLYKREGLARY